MGLDDTDEDANPCDDVTCFVDDPSDPGNGGGSGDCDYDACVTANPDPPNLLTEMPWGLQTIPSTPVPNSPTTSPTPCQQAVLNAVNNMAGTNANGSNILPGSPTGRQSGGQVNVNIGMTGLTASQFNALQPGRYAPAGFLGVITGYGPSLHIVAGPTSLDPTALPFDNMNNGGTTSVFFTAHIDSAWADNPLGALFHWIMDVLGKGSRNPCPV